MGEVQPPLIVDQADVDGPGIGVPGIISSFNSREPSDSAFFSTIRMPGMAGRLREKVCRVNC